MRDLGISNVIANYPQRILCSNIVPQVLISNPSEFMLKTHLFHVDLRIHSHFYEMSLDWQLLILMTTILWFLFQSPAFPKFYFTLVNMSALCFKKYCFIFEFSIFLCVNLFSVLFVWQEMVGSRDDQYEVQEFQTTSCLKEGSDSSCLQCLSSLSPYMKINVCITHL